MTDRIANLEGTPNQPRNVDHAKQLLAKLQALDVDYGIVHFQIVYLINEADEDGLDGTDSHEITRQSCCSCNYHGYQMSSVCYWEAPSIYVW